MIDLVECLLSTREALSLVASVTLTRREQTPILLTLRTWRQEDRVEGHPQLCEEFEASLSCTGLRNRRFCGTGLHWARQNLKGHPCNHPFVSGCHWSLLELAVTHCLPQLSWVPKFVLITLWVLHSGVSVGPREDSFSGNLWKSLLEAMVSLPSENLSSRGWISSKGHT